MLARGDMPLLRFMGRRPPTEQAVLARLSSGLRIGKAYARGLSERSFTRLPGGFGLIGNNDFSDEPVIIVCEQESICVFNRPFF